MSEQGECCQDKMSGLQFGLAESLGYTHMVICVMDILDTALLKNRHGKGWKWGLRIRAVSFVIVYKD